MADAPVVQESGAGIDMASESPTTVHVLSKKSSSSGRDTFIFLRARDRNLILKLLVGINQNIIPVTSAKLQRWIHLMDPGSPDFELRPIALTKHTLTIYSSTVAGPAISPDSKELLPPGDYGWFNTDGSLTDPFVWVRETWSFEYATKHVEENPESYWDNPLEFNEFPAAFKQSVLHRNARCFITGSVAPSPTENADFDVCWIFPPAWTYQLMYESNPPPSEFVTVGNAGVLRTDLITLFHDNAFGIDVDDEYRIVVFRDLGDVRLPTRMPRDSACPGPDDKFLREQFRWCLTTHFLGGDINEDYPWQDRVRAAAELGLSGDDPVAPLDDPRWQTELGKDLLAQHLASELYFHED